MFNLNEDRIRQIAFALENQKHRYVVELRTGAIRREEKLSPDEKPDENLVDVSAPFVPPPSWSSADGFEMMEAFALTVENPLLQTELKNVLASGAGVFHRFKEALRVYPVVEQRWFLFKRSRLEARIAEWYNALREMAGLEAVEIGADEETDDLVQQSFTIREVAFEGDRSSVLVLDREIFEELSREIPPGVRTRLYTVRELYLKGVPPLRRFGAFSPRNEECGTALLVSDSTGSDGSLLRLVLLYVPSEYRGLGIGGALADAVVAAAEGFDFIVVETTGNSPGIRRRMERELGERLIWSAWAIERRQSGDESI